MRTISHFSTCYHSHNYSHTICICMPRSPHLPCLDTCDAATSILSAELLKVHLKSVQQNAVHGEKQIIEMNNIKIYFHSLLLLFLPPPQHNSLLLLHHRVGEGVDYEIEFRFISWIFNNKMWCMHISHCFDIFRKAFLFVIVVMII